VEALLRAEWNPVANQIISAVRILRRVNEGADYPSRLTDLIRRYVSAAFYADPRDRLPDLARVIVREMSKGILPDAQQAGFESARPILKALGRSGGLSDAARRAMKRYSAANLQAFKAQLEAEVGSLSGNVQAAFAKAYRDGTSRADLIGKLLEADKAELESIAKARRRVSAAAKQMAAAEGDAEAVKAARKELAAAKRSTRAVTGFVARFENAVQAEARDTVRRQAQRGQFAAFQSQKFGTFTWVSVNGEQACPDCSNLHGKTKTATDWRGRMPGDGQTVCGDSCMCQLVPASYAAGNPSLEKPLTLVA
jgi:hypothetical protein